MATVHYQKGIDASTADHNTFVDGDLITCDFYDSDLINGSGSAVRYTGTTISAKQTHWPDADGYFYDNSGKQFQLIGELNVLKFGAKGDNSNDDADAFSAAIAASDLEAVPSGGSQIQIPTGSYILGSTITLDKPGTSLMGHGNDSTVLKANHTTGPVVRVAADKCMIKSLAVQSTGARSGATPGSNYGILHEPTDKDNTAIVLCRYQEVSVYNQPSHGMVLCVGLLLTEITNCAFSNNDGHGIVIDDGTETGRAEADRKRAGSVTIKDSFINGNSGHAVKAGSIWSGGENISVYRLDLTNVEATNNATDSAVRDSAHSFWLLVQSSKVELCGIGGSVDDLDPIGGIYLKGSSAVLRNNRFINVKPNAIHIAGDFTSGIIVEDFFVAGTTALELDPAIKIDSDVEHVAVHNQYDNNIVQNEVDVLVTPGRAVDLADQGYRRIPSSHNAQSYTSGDPITLANDTAVVLASFNSTDPARGLLALGGNIGSSGGGLIQFRVLNNNTATIIAQSSANVLETHIGVLNGTTGNVGKVTVSTAPFNTNIYLENRTGSTRTFTPTFLSLAGVNF